QLIIISQNLTLRFFENSEYNTCSYSNSSDVLTFTTFSIPLLSHCFDFSDLFGGNATQGFVNQTGNLDSKIHLAYEPGIHWQLENMNKYDPTKNYSKILYRQHNYSSSEDSEPGRYADRKVNLYGGENCTELSPNKTTGLYPWFGLSCWSEDEGSCGTIPYDIASFAVQPGPEDSDKDGTCMVFAEEGAATSSYRSRQAISGALVSTAVAIWLAM
ncbi:hypothetical protein K491DRAFT_609738, partial [Lophiostoma macrostomum CBS 122681]